MTTDHLQADKAVRAIAEYLDAYDPESKARIGALRVALHTIAERLRTGMAQDVMDIGLVMDAYGSVGRPLIEEPPPGS